MNEHLRVFAESVRLPKRVVAALYLAGMRLDVATLNQLEDLAAGHLEALKADVLKRWPGSADHLATAAAVTVGLIAEVATEELDRSVSRDPPGERSSPEQDAPIARNTR